MIGRKLHIVILFTLSTILYSNNTSAQCSQSHIQANDVKGCAPHIISLKAQNLPGEAKADWIIGNDTFPDRKDLSRAYRKAQTLDVTLLVKKEGDVICKENRKHLIEIEDKPNGWSVNADKNQLCQAPGKVNFSVNSDPGNDYQWIIANERFTNQGNNLTYQFQSPGSKSVFVRVTNEAGCTAAKTFDDFIEVFEKPNLSIDVDSQGGVAPFNTEVELSSSKQLVDIQWDFPGASNIKSPNSKKTSVAFQNEGSYNGSVSVKTKNGCQYTQSLDQKVKVVKPANLNFKVNKKEVCPGEKVNLINLTSRSNGQFEWKIQGPKTAITKKQRAPKVKVSDAGNYSITLNYKKDSVVQSITKRNVFEVTRFSVGFKADPACNCKAPATINLKNQVQSSASTQYQWRVTKPKGPTIFTSNQPNPSLDIDEEGYYDVKLTATNRKGCRETVKKDGYLEIGQLTDELDLDFENYAVNEPIQLDFPDDSFCTKDPLNVTWLVWDQDRTKVLKKSLNHNPTFTFQDSGKYKVDLKVSTKDGCEQSVSTGSDDNPVDVKKPDPDFNVDTAKQSNKPFKDSGDNTYCRNENFVLVQQTVPTALNYSHSWKITHQEDPSIQKTGTGETFETNLNKPGIYDVTYTATVNSVVSFKEKKKGFLKVRGTSVNWQSQDLDHCIPYKGKVKAKLDSQGTFPAPRKAKRQITWKEPSNDDFSLVNKQGDSALAKVTKAGNYDATIKVKGPKGCNDTYTANNLLQVGLNADFNLPDQACFGNKLKATNKSYTGDSKTRYAWKSFDSNVSLNKNNQAANQVFDFSDSGSYKVALSLADSNGCRDTHSQNIKVERVFTDFTTPDTFNHCAHAMVDFQAQSSPNVEKYQWNFGDGHSLNTKNASITKVYKQNSGDSSSGFDVSLTAISGNGCRKTVEKEEYVTIVGPVIDFEISETTKCEPVKVDFQINGRNYTEAFASYGDKSNLDTAPSLQHTYHVKNSGGKATYQPFVLAKDESGCYAVSELDTGITVYGKPDAKFTMDTTKGCAPLKVNFKNQSKHSVLEQWAFSDTSALFERGIFEDTISRTLHEGRHSVTMVATTDEGCTDTAILEDSLKSFEYPKTDFGLNKDFICPEDEFTLLNESNGDNLPVRDHKWVVEVEEGMDSSNTETITKLSYDSSGKYDVSLTSTNVKGCQTTTVKDDFIEIQPNVENAPDLKYVTNQSRNKAEKFENLKSIHWEASKEEAFKHYKVLAEVNGKAKPQIIATIDKRSKTQITHEAEDAEAGYKMMVEGQCGFASDTTKKHMTADLEVESNVTYTNKLSWSHYKGWTQVDAYEIQRAKEGQSFEAIDTVQGDQCLYEDDKLCRGEYYYQVVALNQKDGYRSWSTPSSESPQYIRPEFNRPLLNSTVKQSATVTEWEKPKSWNPESYRLERKDANSTHWQLVASDIQNRKWTDEQAKPNQKSYQYRIMAVNHCQEPSPQSDLSSTVHLQVESTDKSMKLDWGAGKQWINKVQYYELQVKKHSNAGFQTINTVSNDKTTYIDDAPHTDADTTLTYRVKAHASNGLVTASNTASESQPSIIHVPNAFTPNRDGLNDEFKVKGQALRNMDGQGLSEFKMAIYNQWGEKVFLSKDPQKGWDGTNSKGESLNPDTYIYVIHAVTRSGQNFSKKGEVRLLQ